MQAPAERIELPAVGAVVRKYRHEDLDALQAAIELSRDHLRPYMFWADQSRDATEQFLAEVIAAWDEGESFTMGIFDLGDDTTLGGTGLRPSGEPAVLEIGYWVRVDAEGRGIITAAARALTAAGLAVPGIERVEIHCDVTNTRSAQVPKRLGYRLRGIIDKPPQAPGETGRQQVWSIAAVP